jgi:hypothetical protein
MCQPQIPSSEASEAKQQEAKEEVPHQQEVEDHQDPLAHQEEVPQQEDTELVEEPEEDQEEEENYGGTHPQNSMEIALMRLPS